MPSFVCDVCQDTVKKPKLDQHRCRGTFSCIDCGVTFKGTEYRTHTSCVSEAEKYQKSLYRGKRVLPNTPGTPNANKTNGTAGNAAEGDGAAGTPTPPPAKRKADAESADEAVQASSKRIKSLKKVLASAAEDGDLEGSAVTAVKLAIMEAGAPLTLDKAIGPAVAALTEAGFEGANKKSVRAALMSRVRLSLNEDEMVKATWK